MQLIYRLTGPTVAIKVTRIYKLHSLLLFLNI